jgi:large subunit ribosomal protein L3
MNHALGLIGRKLGMTQFFDEDGTINRVTAVEAGPCVVVSKRTPERDGYTALQIGFEDIPDRLVTMPVRGQYTKAGSEPKRIMREIRVSDEVAAQYKVGDQLTVDQVFKVGDRVDVVGTSKGRGFSGVVRRYHFAGSVSTHGSHEYFRHGGSIGQNMTPGRVFKGVKMPGQHGNKRITTQNMRIVGVDVDANVILIRGSVPGAKKSFVMVRGAVKKRRSEES